MSLSCFEPQIKQHTAIVHLKNTVLPLVRWSIDSRYVSTLVVVTVKNTSDDDLTASLKFQDSNGSPADDHQMKIAIPYTGTPGQDDEVSDSGDSPDVVEYEETFGGFNSTFTDLSGGAVANLVPGGETTITFTTKKSYLQLVATTANNAKVMLFIKSMNTLSPTESDDVRTNTALPLDVNV